MTELTTIDGLRDFLSDLEKEQKQALKKLARLKARQEKLNAERSNAEIAAGTLERDINKTKCRIFVRQAISPELVNARDILIKKFKLLQDDQITVARQRELEAEIENYQPQLQKFCPHPFIFAYARYGQRVCTLCNLGETSKSTRDSIYGILVDDSTRLVLRDLRERDELPKLVEQEWFTINFLKQLFDASAGGSNVRWPDTIDPASVLKL